MKSVKRLAIAYLIDCAWHISMNVQGERRYKSNLEKSYYN